MDPQVITARAVMGMFYERLMQNTGGSWIEPIATPIMNSDQDSEQYGWLGMVPQLSVKGGQKSFDQLRSVDWTVNNVEYQGGLAIPKKHILYDKTGQVMIRVNELADRYLSHWVSLIAPLIINGESAVCYDGEYFFDTDHEEGDSGSQSNDIGASASTPTAPTPDEFITAVMAAIEQMLGFKDDKGEYVNEDMNDFLILTGTPLLQPAMQAISQTRISNGDSNILIEQDNFRLRVRSSARFSSWTTKFAVFATQGNQKPILRQQRIPNNPGPGFARDGAQFEQLWLDSEYCKLHDEVLMSIETERAAAYGDWKKACLVTFS